MGDNLKIWNRFCETPEAATKSFNKGGWHGTDINPAYRLRCLTDLFGPQGTGWGWTIHERWRETWPARVKVGERWEDYNAECAFVCLSLWYVENGERKECSPQIGGTECDLAPDEVWKMSITDAIGKCCLALGIAADVYMGQFDGKHRDAPARERAPALPACPACGETKGVIKGKEEFGGGLVCYGKKGGCGHKWHPPTEADKAASATTEKLLAEGKLTTGDKVAAPPNAYSVALETLAKYKKVSELVSFANYVKEQRIAHALTVEQYHDLDRRIAAKACEFPTNEQGFTAAEKLLRAMHGELRLSEGDYLEVCTKLADAKDSKLGAAA